MRLKKLLLGLVVLALAGCVQVQPIARAKEQVVTQRVQAYWDAIVAKDYQKAYEYLAPAYRERLNYLSHMLSNPPRMQYVKVFMLGVECQTEESCLVTLDQTYDGIKGLKVKVDGPINRSYVDKWIKINGEWWRHVP